MGNAPLRAAGRPKYSWRDRWEEDERRHRQQQDTPIIILRRPAANNNASSGPMKDKWLEKNEDGSEMSGYELPNYGSKPITLDVDDEHYGVTMEQLKKLLRPSSNNNEEDEESKEDMNIVNSITTSVPAYRRPATERLVSTPRHYAILPNSVQDPVSEDDEEEEVKDFEEEEELIFKNSSNGFHNYYDDDRPLDVNIRRKDSQEEEELLRIGGIKSNSVAAFASSNSSSPKEDLASTARHRSLPARRNDSARTDLKSPSESRYLSNNTSRRTALGVMPSSLINRRLPTAASNNSTLTSAYGGGPSLSQSRASSNNKFTASTPGQNGTTGRISTNGVPVDFQHSQDPRNRLQSALKNINSSDWEDKVEGIRKLDELVSTNAESVASDVHTVALALLVEVKNLRSQVSRVAIQSMGNLFQYCGRYLDQDLERAVRLLLNRAGDTNRFIRDDAHVALMAVTQYISPPRAIIAITAEGLSHKNAAVRAEAAKLLAAIVERLGPNRSLSGAKDVTERLLPAAAVFIQDGNLEARAQAKRMFSVLMQDPVFDRAVQKYLTASVIRNIQRTLDQLRKNI